MHKLLEKLSEDIQDIQNQQQKYAKELKKLNVRVDKLGVENKTIKGNKLIKEENEMIKGS